MQIRSIFLWGLLSLSYTSAQSMGPYLLNFAGSASLMAGFGSLFITKTQFGRQQLRELERSRTLKYSQSMLVERDAHKVLPWTPLLLPLGLVLLAASDPSTLVDSIVNSVLIIGGYSLRVYLAPDIPSIQEKASNFVESVQRQADEWTRQAQEEELRRRRGQRRKPSDDCPIV